MCTQSPDWELHTDLQHQPITFCTAETKKSQYGLTPYNNAHAHLEEWAPEQESQESDDDGEMYSLTGFSPIDSNHIPIENYQLRKSITRPLMGEVKCISDLESQHLNTRLSQSTCSAALQQRFLSYRPVLAHDSSGWYALAFSYFEVLLYSRSKVEVDEEISRILSLNNLLKTAGQYEVELIKNMINETVNLLKDLSSFKERSLKTASILLLRRFNDPGVSDAIICHLRLIASSWLVAKSANYKSYIPDGLTVETYRNRWLNAPHREIDTLAMRLLVDVLLRPLHGVEFDVTCMEEDETTTRFTYPTVSTGLNGKDSSINNNSIYLLRRSNHYDILYREDRTKGEGKKNSTANLPPLGNNLVMRAEFGGNATSSTESFESFYQFFDRPSLYMPTPVEVDFDTVPLGNLRLSESGMDLNSGVDVPNRSIHARTATIQKTFEAQKVALDLDGLSNIVGFDEVEVPRNSVTGNQQNRAEEIEPTTASIMIASTQASMSPASDVDLPRKCATNVQFSKSGDGGEDFSTFEQPIIQEELLGLAIGSLIEEPSHSDEEFDDDDELDWEEVEVCNKEETTNHFQSNSDITWDQFDGKSTIKSFLENVKGELLNCFMKEFWDIANQTLMSNIRTHGSSPQSSSPSPDNNESPGKQLSSFTLGKRSFEGGDDEPSEQDRERGSKKPKSALTSLGISDEPPHFACPYRKHNPRKYNVNQWAACALTPQKGVSRVKAHLYRNHRTHQCQRCKSLFKTRPELDKHIVALEGCSVKDFDPKQLVEGITDILKEKIQCRKKLYNGQTEAERWQQIYQLLFPNEIVPDPFFEPVRDLEDDACQTSDSQRLEEHLRREVPRVFRHLLETDIGNTLQTIEEQLKNRLLDLLEKAQNQALASYHPTSRGIIETLATSPILEPQHIDLGLPTSRDAAETSYQSENVQSETLIQSETPHHASFDSGCYDGSWNTGYSHQITGNIARNNMDDESSVGMQSKLTGVENSGSPPGEVWQLGSDPMTMDSLNCDIFDSWTQQRI